MDDTPVPPVYYPFRNKRGRWEVDGLELESEGDKEYITSLLEFQELMAGCEEINKGSNVELTTADTKPSFCVGNNTVTTEANNEPVTLKNRWYQ